MQELESSDDVRLESLNLETLPKYLQDEFKKLCDPSSPSVRVLSLDQIRKLPSSSPPTNHDRYAQYAHLLLLRYHLIECMCRLSDEAQVSCAICPELVLERAKVYEALAYSDLALADAYVAFSVAAGEEEDLRAVSVDGVPWEDEDKDEHDDDDDGDDDDRGAADGDVEDNGQSPDDETIEDRTQNIPQRTRFEEVGAVIKRDSLTIIVRALRELGCTGELPTWESFLQQAQAEWEVSQAMPKDRRSVVPWTIYDDPIDRAPTGKSAGDESDGQEENSMFGLSRREIYPWNEYEPADRLSDESLKDLNESVYEASSGCLEVRKTVLPSFPNPASSDDGHSKHNSPASTENAQLGLFAVRDLAPSQTILREHSVLTAIRPHDAPLCDSCAADLPPPPSNDAPASTSTSAPTKSYACPACSIPFCSQRCLSIALSTYHLPNLDNTMTDAGYPPSTSPFCSGTSAHADIHELGRAESSDEPEWDLYFLLVARCFTMAETRGVHPLAMKEVKWLWGGFNPLPKLCNPVSSSDTSPASDENILATGIKRTLPFSLPHSLLHPHTFFTTTVLSLPHTSPYSTHWLRNYDFWNLQTLYAKFRGVADAKQSSWDGEPESAGVFGLWCLGNHSCAPNVEWETRGGEWGGRVFRVRDQAVWRKEVSRPVSGNDRADVDGAESGLVAETQDEIEWKGIKKGEQIWNHYTDVREDDFRVRRGRLKEVLGGDCMCERCVGEEEAWKVEQREDIEERKMLKMLSINLDGQMEA